MLRGVVDEATAGAIVAPLLKEELMVRAVCLCEVEAVAVLLLGREEDVRLLLALRCCEDPRGDAPAPATSIFLGEKDCRAAFGSDPALRKAS